MILFSILNYGILFILITRKAAFSEDTDVCKENQNVLESKLQKVLSEVEGIKNAKIVQDTINKERYDTLERLLTLVFNETFSQSEVIRERLYAAGSSSLESSFTSEPKSKADVKSPLMTTKNINTVLTPPSKETDPKRTLQIRKIRETTQDFMNFSKGETYLCFSTYCLNLIKEEHAIDNPALCHIGNSCNLQCNSSCLGRFCESNGGCVFGSENSCDDHGCHLDSGLIQNLQLKERPPFLVVGYDAPQNYKFNNGLKIIYWTFTSHTFNVDVVTEDNLPLLYQTKYFVCLMFISNNSMYLEDIECQTIITDQKCLGIPAVRFFGRGVTFSRQFRYDVNPRQRYNVFQHKIYLSFKGGNCGEPTKKTLSFTIKGRTFQNPPNLRGDWEVCVVAEKQVHDEECNKNKKCRDINLGQEIPKVENFMVKEDNSDLKISWTVPESWQINCGLYMFKIRILSQTRTPLKEIDEYQCQSGCCSLSIVNDFPSGNYSVEVIPIFDRKIKGLASIKYVNL